MGRPRKWTSDAERKRAERQKAIPQKREPVEAETEHIPPADAVASKGMDTQSASSGGPSVEEAPIVQQAAFEQALRNHHGYSASEKRTAAERQAAADRIVGGESSLTEESYVAQQVEITKAQWREPAPDSVQSLEDAVARTASYARWRWNAFQAGEVASL